MIKTFNKFRINFATVLLMMSSFFYIVSCNDTVDGLWDDSNPRDDYSPVIGDWYADSIKAYYSCVKTADSTSDVMSNSYIDNYNLWFLSDGSLQLYFDQTVNLKTSVSIITEHGIIQQDVAIFITTMIIIITAH